MNVLLTKLCLPIIILSTCKINLGIKIISTNYNAFLIQLFVGIVWLLYLFRYLSRNITECTLKLKY